MSFCRSAFVRRTGGLGREDGRGDEVVDPVAEVVAEPQGLARVGRGRTQQRAAEASRTYLMTRRRAGTGTWSSSTRPWSPSNVLRDPLGPGTDALRDRRVKRRARAELLQDGHGVGLAEGRVVEVGWPGGRRFGTHADHCPEASEAVNLRFGIAVGPGSKGGEKLVSVHIKI